MKTLSYKSALLSSGWARDVSIKIDAGGEIAAIETGVANITDNACAVPGMANLHSHAHQRAMAGLAERSGDSHDSFWTWRETMYHFAQAIGPQHLAAISAQLYIELLKAGYTRVAEFQYLHHQADGSPYQQIAEMSLQTMASASETGIGITNLPVLYQYGGFGDQPPTRQQRRFINTPETFLRLCESLRESSGANRDIVNGLAAHSLRAVSTESLAEVLAELGPLPVHIHIAEQAKEVEDCIAWCGTRPVQYLMDNFPVDENWCLVHATHMDPSETQGLADSGAVAGLCPTTEANLGDGFFNATPYLQAGGKIGIGSDSHISVSPVEELRWLEYGQRLVHHSRNQLAGASNCSTGHSLFSAAAAGGAQACGHNSGTIEVGKRADLVVLDTSHPLLCERVEDELLDSWIFSGNQNVVRDVYVGGEQVISGGCHPKQEAVQSQFSKTLRELRT